MAILINVPFCDNSLEGIIVLWYEEGSRYIGEVYEMITGVIVTGGQSRRMGGRTKVLLPFPKLPLIVLQLAEMSNPTLSTARLAADFTKPSPYPRYVRGVYKFDQGSVWVKPIGPDKSSVMVSLIDTTASL